jgi:NAD(P)H-dependent FMN reductase
MLQLKLIVGSTRPGRAADVVVPWVERRARDHGRFEVEVLDLRDWVLPVFTETFETLGDVRNPTYSEPIVKRWNGAIAAGDAYLFVTPEYNHSIPGVLKNAIDSVFASFAFRNKPVAVVAYSGGIVGGARAAEHLADIGGEAEFVSLRNNVLIPFVQDAFDGTGAPKNPQVDRVAGVMLDDLAWWAHALREARGAGILPPAQLRLMATSETVTS